MFDNDLLSRNHWKTDVIGIVLVFRRCNPKLGVKTTDGTAIDIPF